MTLRIYYLLLGQHYHCRLFANGAKAGDLVLRKAEFTFLQDLLTPQVEFREEESPFRTRFTPEAELCTKET